ncbi:hypothetical protein MKW92_044971 [Papaver armeniacum]|nr:hypothetical protein MKW92_044971 [Papaver armeniacum]
MGRSDQDELTTSQILYPYMQCADLGMDQLEVNPVILSHHMLPGLRQGHEKMSKSDPSSSIYMEDMEAEFNVKIKKAYCPPKIVARNPCLEYIKYIVFPWFGVFETYETMEELIADYENNELYTADLNPALSKPVRDHFNNDPNAKALLKRVKSYYE